MLTDRAIADELMDADDLAPETYVAVMRDLAQVNTLTLARRPTLAFIDEQLRERAVDERPLRILDVGFGDGDMLRAIKRRWGERVAATGIDLNPRSLAAARSATPPTLAIDWRIGDYAALADQSWDVIISSLVAHHMTHDELVAFLRFMEREAHRGWFVNDLHRHRFAYYGYPLLAAVMRWHPIVRHDGQLSIARSYRPHEWTPLLAAAGVTDARVFRAFPFRLCVSRVR
jgi:SAM-dependent methyltransferase